MKFIYRYQDKERGVLEGEIAASSESDAHSALRKSGIRPMNVWPKPGLVNRLSAIGKRGLAIVVLCALCLALAAIVFTRTPGGRRLAVGNRSLPFLPRQQLPSVEVSFGFESERVLALFARPGDMGNLEGVQIEALSLGDLDAALQTPLAADAGDSPDAVRLKRIVSGLKAEVAAALDTGDSKEDVIVWLLERQRMEADYRANVVRELKARHGETNRAAIAEANAVLKTMRLRQIGPDELQ